MKKFIGNLVIATFLVLPLNAFADYLYTEKMQISGSGDVWNNWYTDYQTSSGDGVFCVENADLDKSYVEYDFYTIDNSLIDKYKLESDYVDLLNEATWYANSWATGSATKTEAQIAIWKTLFLDVTTDPTSDALGLMNKFDKATNQDAYVSDWLFAVSPGSNPRNITIGEEGQNFLVAAPVPEPATMMLFGIGLLGLAGVSRKKKRQK